MARLIYSTLTSLDGYVADESGMVYLRYRTGRPR